MSNIKELFEFLAQNKFGSLATCTENQPDNRPMECVFASDKGLFFYTKKGEELEEQLNKNKSICFTATDPTYNYMKVRGSVVWSHEEDDQRKILESSSFAKKVFEKDTLSSMIVFYVPHGKAMLHSHGKHEPVCFEF